MKPMKKTVLAIICFIYIVLPIKVSATDRMDEEGSPPDAATEEDIQGEMVDSLSLQEVNSYWLQFQDEYGEFISDIPSKNIAEMIKDDDSISFKSIMKGLGAYLFYEIIVNAKLLGTLLMLTLFSIILQAISAAFEKSSVSQVAYFIVFIFLIYITLISFYLVFTYLHETILQQSHIMITLLLLTY